MKKGPAIPQILLSVAVVCCNVFIGAASIFWWISGSSSFKSVEAHETASASQKMASDTLSKYTGACIYPAKVRIFMYHYVRDPIPVDAKIIVQLSVPIAVFESHMKQVRSLADSGRVALLSLSEVERAKETHCYPNANNFVFTDDDGWIDLYTHLYPIAQKYQIPFAFGIISSKLTQPGFVKASEVLEMSQNPLFTIVSHSVHHNDQDVMTKGQETVEICDSRTALEQVIGKPVTTYIFPSGRMSTNSAEILRDCGYTLGFSTNYGKSWDESGTRLDINRSRVFPETLPDHFEKILK